MFTTLQCTWFLIIVGVFGVFVLLDGIDLGIGIMLPFTGRTRADKRLLMDTIAPIWDGNEVWMVVGGASLFAAFPRAYAAALSALYLPLGLILFALTLRVVSFDFFLHDERRGAMWSWVFAVASFLLTFLLAAAAGIMVAGIPLDPQGNFFGNPLSLLGPIPLLTGAAGVLLVLLHGCAFALKKTPAPLNTELAAALRKLIPFAVLAQIAFAFALLFTIPGAAGRVPVWLAILAGPAAMALLWKNASGPHNAPLVRYTAISCAALWGALACALFPQLVRSSTDPTLSLTIANAASGATTLKALLPVACLSLPAAGLLSIFLYRTFKGAVTPGNNDY